ncbi:hypothetical protein J6590_079352 [Homalodisca vitripennis]|nr:hypothetical protein J6590_079352 [Homalodisca vitripennis]
MIQTLGDWVRIEETDHTDLCFLSQQMIQMLGDWCALTRQTTRHLFDSIVWNPKGNLSKLYFFIDTDLCFLSQQTTQTLGDWGALKRQTTRRPFDSIVWDPLGTPV